MGRPVAIKVPRQPITMTSEERSRFLTEARAVGALRHPNIIAVHEVGYQENTPFIVCELIDGTALNHAMSEKRFPVRDACRIVQQIAEAVEHAHRHGIVHRDMPKSIR